MRLWLIGVLMVFAGAAFAADFVPGIAVNDAGKLVDPETSRFFVFYIPAGTAPDAVAANIKNNLVQASKTHASLGIIGPDYSLNAKILGGILQSTPEGLLQGASILLVNGGEDVEELKTLAARAGATFRATAYSGK
jgi:hypothetical protein